MRYVEAPQQKFIQYTVQKFMIKEQSLTAERGKLVRQSQQDLLQTWIGSVLLYNRVQKSPPAQEPRAWDISNKPSANAKEGPD